MGRPIKNIIGQRFGKLVVLELTNEKSGTCVVWKCLCDCGNIKHIRSSHLNAGPASVQSCGCIHNHNLINKTFDRLTVISDSGERSLNYQIMWKCKCVCGNFVNIRTDALISGATKSCGCLRKEKIKEANTVHGFSNLPEYGLWYSMIHRCHSSNDSSYKRYGAIGITVCDRWLNSFELFYTDMGPRPSPEHSIDRINNDGNYEPDNCRWATAEEQQNNRKDNVSVVYNGKIFSSAMLAKEHDINTRTFTSRLRNGWSVKDSVEIPVKKTSRKG